MSHNLKCTGLYTCEDCANDDEQLNSDESDNEDDDLEGESFSSAEE